MNIIENKILSATFYQMAQNEPDAKEKLFKLKRAFELDPENFQAKAALEAVQNIIPLGFVAIERVVEIGTVNRNYEGQILKEMPDGSLKHVDGKDMDYLIQNYPNFIKNWKIEIE